MNIRLLSHCIPLLVSTALLLPACSRDTQVAEGETGVRVLFLLPGNVGANYFLVRDAVEEYGWEVSRTAVLDTVPPCPFWGQRLGAIPFVPDFPLAAVDDITDWDALFLPASPGNAAPIDNPYADIIGSREALGLIASAVEHGIPLFSTCTGSLALARAGVLRGRRIVGSPRFREIYEEAGAVYAGNDRNDTPPVIDDPIITSARGQTYNLAQVMAVATLIENRQPRGAKAPPGTAYLSEGTVRFDGGEILWARTFGGPGADGARSLTPTSDGGYLMAGYTFPPGMHDADLLLVKADADGRLEWSRIFGGAGTEYGHACAEVADGFLVTGYTTSWGAGGKDLWVLKTDRFGRQQWSRTFGGESWDVGSALLAADDGCLFVCGFTHSYGAGEEDVWVLKLGSDGRLLWSRTYGGARIEMGNSIWPAPEGGLLIGATSLTYGGTNSDFWIVRADAGGDTLWTRSCRGIGPAGHAFDWCRSSTPDGAGGLLLVGYADCNDLMDAVAIRIDAAGDEMWQLYFGNNPYYDYALSAVQAADGGFLVAGLSKRLHDVPRAGEDIHDNQIAVVKLSASGEIVWEKRFGGEGSERAAAIAPAPDGGIVLAGQTSTAGGGSFDLCLVKLTASPVTGLRRQALVAGLTSVNPANLP